MFNNGKFLVFPACLIFILSCGGKKQDALPIDYLYVEKTFNEKTKTGGLLVLLPGQDRLFVVGDYSQEDNRNIIRPENIPQAEPFSEGNFKEGILIRGENSQFYPVLVSNSVENLTQTSLEKFQPEYILIAEATDIQMEKICALPFKRAVIVGRYISPKKMNLKCRLQGIPQDTFTDPRLYELPKTIFFFSHRVSFSG